MTITEQQLANAAKALGVDCFGLKTTGTVATIMEWISQSVVDRQVLFGPGFAEWAVPVLEERHPVDLIIYRIKQDGPDSPWYVDDVHTTLCEEGPDIATAVFLIAAKIGEGME